MAEDSHNPFDMGASAPADDLDQLAPPSDAPADAPGGGALDANLFATPAADSYNPAGTAAQAPEDESGDPDARIAWRKDNAAMLEGKEEEEKKDNEAVKTKAQEWLKRFHEERTTRINAAKADNEAQEQAATKGPQGNTDWEKMNSMIDFTFKPPQEMEGERERFKSLLLAAKEKNVPTAMA
eukprot:jgi/Ulvmu1/11203/UM072_0039.1